MVSAKKPSLKSIYKEASGKNVTKDFFVYSCMAENSNQEKLNELGEVVSWGLLNQSLSSPEFTERSLEELIPELCRWHKTNCPSLAAQGVIDYEICAQIIEPCTFLVRDLQRLVALKTGKNLDGKADEGIWTTITAELDRSFPAIGEYIGAFLRWKSSRATNTNYDIDSLPPEGRYFGVLKARISHTPSSSPRAAREDRGQSRSQSLGSKTGGRAEGAPPTRRDYAGGGQRRDGGRRDREGSRDYEKQEVERLALLEVDKAVLALKNHPSMNEFRLRPQNSFVRRLQHQKVSDLGLYSSSVGEGEDRSVLITTRED